MKLSEVDLSTLPESNIFRWSPELWEDWIYEKNKGIDITNLPKSSGKIKAWWKCSRCNNEAYMTLRAKYNNTQCDYCLGRRVNDTNSLAKVLPDVSDLLNKQKHNPNEIFYRNSKDVFSFICSLCNLEFENKIPQVRRAVEKTKTTGCPYCASKKTSIKNSLITKRPWITKIWNYEKNAELKISPDNVTPHSRKQFYFNCFHCGELEKQEIQRVKHLKYQCDYCLGKKINDNNSLAKKHFARKYWDYEKNTDNPHSIYYNTEDKFWWKCHECNDSYLQSAYEKHKKKSQCPYCTGRVIKKGNNDLATKNPLVHSWMNDKELGFQVGEYSHKYTEFICPTCNTSVGEKKISDIATSLSVPCENCTKGTSRAERMFREILKLSNIEFETEKIFDWSGKKRYDFYLPAHNIIIELHGEQHYLTEDKGYFTKEVLEKIQANDKYKRKIAKANGIKHYFEINCSDVNPRRLYQSMKNHLEQLEFLSFNSDNLNSILINSLPVNKREILKRYTQGESIDTLAKEYGYKASSLKTIIYNEQKHMI